MTTNPVVLDSSALLALLYDEPGAGELAPLLPTARTSSITWAEVVRQVLHRGGNATQARTLEHLGLIIETFDAFDADLAADLAVGELGDLPMHDLAMLVLARTSTAPLVTLNPTLADLGGTLTSVKSVVLEPSP